MNPQTFLRHGRTLAFGTALLGLLSTTPAPAAGEPLDEVGLAVAEIDRDALDFRRVAPKPTDPPLTYDTALVFSNTGRTGARVLCKGFDDQGTPIGRAATFVPALGLRYLLASDFGDGSPNLGQVQCATQGRVLGSAFLLGGNAGITSVPASQGDHDGAVRIRFPVVLAQ